MAAPLGFKTFNTGDVLTAADTNGYLMQGVWTFADSAARSAAVTSPQEGNVSFLKDTNSLEIYDGAAWVAYGSGDITGVTAGTGISGGGTSGTVTVTNSMATAIDAKGDLIAGTGADAFSRLAVGTNGQYLVADSTTATGLKWGDVSAGSLTQLATGTLSGSTTAVSFSTTGYRNVWVLVTGVTANNPFELGAYYNGNSGLSQHWITTYNQNGSYGNNGGTTTSTIPLSGLTSSNGAVNTNTYQMTFFDVQNTSTAFPKLWSGSYSARNNLDTARNTAIITGASLAIGAMSSLTFVCGGASFNGGTYYIFGVK